MHAGESAPPPDSPPAAEPLTRPIIVLTILTVGGYAARLLVQVATARYFGAGSDLDSFFAAFALPQYVSAIAVGVLASVLIPVIIGTRLRGGAAEAARAVQGITAIVIGCIFVVTIACAALASPLLRITTPGLTPREHAEATRLAWILWPTAIASAALVIASTVDNAGNRFVRAAIAPVAGGVVNLLMLIALARPFGITGAAIATTAGAFAQLVPFLPGWRLPSARFRLREVLDSPGVREALSLLWPLLLSGVFVRITIVAERYFGSHLAAGSITEITYASGISAIAALLLSTGIGTVFFPRMADEAAREDLPRLATTLSTSMRGMWVITAPVVLIGAVLAQPFTAALLAGGRFSTSAAAHVAVLLQIYFLATAASALGILTGRALYSLKATRLVAVASAFEAVAYVIYTAVLVRWLGATGVAWGYAIYLSLSIPWHLAVIVRRARWTSFASTAAAMMQTAIAAGAGAAVAFFVSRLFGSPWPQLIAGGSAGVFGYAAALALISRSDVILLFDAARAATRGRSNRASVPAGGRA